MAATFTHAELTKAVNHIFLPPKLPDQEDEECGDMLVRLTADALKALRSLVTLPQTQAAIEKAIHVVLSLRTIHDNSGVNEVDLRNAVATLKDEKTIAVNVSAQNAAVLVTRKQDQLMFEQFERSPRNQAVLAAQGRLVRSFPSAAVAIRSETLDEADCAPTIARTIATMANQSVAAMQPRTRKAGAAHYEDRDTTDPAIVSDLLFGALQGIGNSTLCKCSRISKKTREEVLWKDARRPWRRSPIWLLIRVALQLTISRAMDDSHVLDKKAMCFLMSHALEKVPKLDTIIDSDLLYIMNAKIDWRRQKLLKMGEALHDPAGLRISTATRTCNDALSVRWSDIQKGDVRPVPLLELASLDFEGDSLVRLPDLDDHIQRLRTRCLRSDVSAVCEGEKAMPGLLKCQRDDIAPLPDRLDALAAANIQQFEDWVARALGTWAAKTKPDIVCEKMCSVMKSYHALAGQFYDGNPEGISLMLLTILQLWVACDKAGIQKCDLIGDYSIQVPVDAFQALLLPRSEQMRQLSEIEHYIASREAKYDFSVMFDITSNHSFAARYFDTSEYLQQLRQTIQAPAEISELAKQREFKQTKQEYARLTGLFQETYCEYKTEIVETPKDDAGPKIVTYHVSDCQRCKYDRWRRNLGIQVHEWPLSSTEQEAKAVSFELRVPTFFAHWREAMSFLLREVLGGCRNSASPSTYAWLSSDPHLNMVYQAGVRDRIGLRSENKSMLRTHYQGKALDKCEMKDICLQNGLKYRYYDAISGSYVGDYGFSDDLALRCTYILPRESKKLQRFLIRRALAPDGHPPNRVIASSRDFPGHMTVEEYQELCLLPLGRHVQWANIILQLAMPGIDLKKPETTLTIMQCINQCGPRSLDGSVYRQAHWILRDNSSVIWILHNLQTALKRVQENWESVQAVGCFVSIATRVLSLNDTAQEAYLAFLSESRTVVTRWMQIVRNKSREARSNEDRSTLAAKGAELALVCAATFELDDKLLHLVLQRSEHASQMIFASIMVQEGHHVRFVRQPTHVSMRCLRLQRTMHRSYGLLAQNRAAINLAVRQAWPGYVAGLDGWHRSSTADYWITSLTSASVGRMTIQLNLLDGLLLVKGQALRQLPAHYLETTLFQGLFGEAIIEVMPASTPGFEFSMLFDGNMVQLGMSCGNLIVQAMKDGAVFEAVPTGALRHTLSNHFVNDYVLWYNAESDMAELRPLEAPWKSQSARNWILRRAETTGCWQASKDGVSLLATKSRTAKVLSEILRPLATDSHIHYFSQTDGSLLVDVAGLRIGFTLAKNSSKLKSREYPAMLVDEDQTLGTLIGFCNKLILTSTDGARRLVLLLHSKLTYQRFGNHVHVEADTASTNAEIHAIDLDRSLLRFSDNGDLSCKLYMAYLHALTAFCLPDPFTLRTGTEQALMALQSKAVESFDQLSQADVDMIGNMLLLSPQRSFYPAHERVMEQVDWDDQLGFLAQHEGFAAASIRLLQICASAQIYFTEANLQIPNVQRCSNWQYLSERHNIRVAGYRVAGFGAEDHKISEDVLYTARDSGSAKSRAIARVSSHFCRNGDALYRKPPTLQRVCDLMQSVSLVHGPQLSVDISNLQYDGTLIRGGLQSVIALLPSLHNLAKSYEIRCRKRKFAVMLWISTLAFADDADLVVLQLLATLFKSLSLSGITPPPATPFNPKDGWEVTEHHVRVLVTHHQRSFEDCPEHRLPREQDEPKRRYLDRRFSIYLWNKNEVIELITNWFVAQGSCETPQRPTLASAVTYLRLTDLITSITPHFKSWFNNAQLRQYLSHVINGMKLLALVPIELSEMDLQCPSARPSYRGFISDNDLFQVPPPQLPQLICTFHVRGGTCPTATHLATTKGIESLIAELRRSCGESVYEHEYLSDLEHSLQALKLKHGTAAEVQQSPRISPVSFLKQLTRNFWPKLDRGWKRCIVQHGLALTTLQRAERLSKLVTNKAHKDDLLRELGNPGHEDWDPMQYPESLLIEIESGILIRERQERIAQEMRDPTTGLNSIMQLNMGEGKSSVIVPIVATALADGSQLVRVEVGKPQSKQMAQMLISKLGGIVGRRIYHLPFSRSVTLDPAAAHGVCEMLRECMNTGGVLLVQPEHILSFKLKGPECFIRKKQTLGNNVLAAQDFLE